MDNITWFQLYSYGSLAICVCIFLFLIILKYIIYYNIMISKTGYLIDTKLLEKVGELRGGHKMEASWKRDGHLMDIRCTQDEHTHHMTHFFSPPFPRQVWEFERSDNIKRISEFIDAIKIKVPLPCAAFLLIRYSHL